MSVWVGADPGGNKHFGVCMLGESGAVQTWLGDSADDAVKWLGDHLLEKPDGAGVDAPLWWSSASGGGRLADGWIRKTYGIHSGTVQSGNSLQGAALIQGAMFVVRLREMFGTIPITETHPKAVLQALGFSRDEFCVRYSVKNEPCSEHESDAMVSAVAAREGFEGRWTLDLAEGRFDSEQDPSSFWLAPVHYYWPES